MHCILSLDLSQYVSDGTETIKQNTHILSTFFLSHLMHITNHRNKLQNYTSRFTDQEKGVPIDSIPGFEL